MSRVVLVPGALALLPEYAGLDDPVTELRAACLDAVAWLGSGPVAVLADAQGARVAAALLHVSGAGGRPAGWSGSAPVTGSPPDRVLVVGNGTACRSEKAPGHLDDRSFAFDDDLRTALSTSDLGRLDLALGESLLASLDGIRRLPEVLSRDARVQVDYDDDPFGVQYWVMRWESE